MCAASGSDCVRRLLGKNKDPCLFCTHRGDERICGRLCGKEQEYDLWFPNPYIRPAAGKPDARTTQAS